MPVGWSDGVRYMACRCGSLSPALSTPITATRLFSTPGICHRNRLLHAGPRG
jgi:hypothetical protein